MFDLDETDPFIGVPSADLWPRQRLSDRRLDRFGSAHQGHVRRVRGSVKFLAIAIEEIRCCTRASVLRP
jgi:hypothetical protein